ncbi:uncharacterized protein LOC130898304 [Diorhabda carinulata]|uniref:uncharacterized protein LOC130898304 n=1 Tax=Diorhabda carinulata TaxID=1163345 RepID=UPI0025A1E780|nr:uncharacterized protein LOC130898304 [Diorhabda carinulata]
MLPKSLIVILLIVDLFLIESSTVRINYVRCNYNGFTCSTSKHNTQLIYFQCPNEDVTLFINQFNSPSNIESLQIQNCKNLTISFGCGSDVRNIESLIIKNIGFLKIQLQQRTSHVPASVSFENIAYLEEIPKLAFAQHDKITHSYNCITPKNDFRTLSFKNVTIGTVQSNAFHMPNKFGDFSFTDVKINRMQASAILVKLDKLSKFTIANSEIDVVEHLAFQTTAKTVAFKQNKFIDIASSGINGTIENFEFSINAVNTLQPYSISILCTNVHIFQNKFEYMKSGALEKISPGLLEDSGMNFGKLKFVYEFKNNTIRFMDAGSINPDIAAYGNVATEIIVHGNRILCECGNIAWIFPGVGHGFNTRYLVPFYENLLNNKSNNLCSSSCDLPLASAIQQLQNGKCLDNVTADWICDNKNKIEPTTTIASFWSTPHPSLTISTRRSIPRPRGYILTIHSSSRMFKPINIILTIGLVFLGAI